MPFTIESNDITRMHVDAVVNAANSNLAPGGGVCGAIFEAAGFDELFDACRKIHYCKVGGAVITPGFKLAKYVIHAVGPRYIDGKHDEEQFLRESYRNALALAFKYGCESVAFPMISSGIYAYPKKEAFNIAVEEIKHFVLTHDINVTLCVFGKEATKLDEQLFASINQFIDDNYETQYGKDNVLLNSGKEIESQLEEQRKAWTAKKSFPADPTSGVLASSPIFPSNSVSLPDFCNELDEPFGTMLLKKIDEKGYRDSDVYKRANIDRKLFSKIKKTDYNPGKNTVLALAVALRLNLEETQHFLACAGYALSHSKLSDLIVEYYIINGNYDIFDINCTLFDFNQKLLGAM